MQTGRGVTPQRVARRKRAERRLRRAGALSVAGAALVGMFAVAGYHVGSAAVTSGFAPEKFDFASEPAPALRKGSLFSSQPLIEVAAPPTAERPAQASLVSAKSDSLIDIFGEPQTVRSKDPMAQMVSPPVELIEKSWQTGRKPAVGPCQTWLYG